MIPGLILFTLGIQMLANAVLKARVRDARMQYHSETGHWRG